VLCVSVFESVNVYDVYVSMCISVYVYVMNVCMCMICTCVCLYVLAHTYTTAARGSISAYTTHMHTCGAW
jgi:hypothetical protein